MPGRGNRFLNDFGEDLVLIQPHLRPVNLAAGEVLYDVGETIRYIYFLRSGAVSNLTPFEDGAEIECALVGRGGAVGAMAALGMRWSITRDVCHMACEAWRLPTERLVEASARSRVIHDALDSYCAWIMTCAVRNGACNACHSVDTRLCRWLLTCSDVLEEDEIALSQDVFAKMLGVQRSSVSPILQKLRRDGLIALERSRLRLLNRAGVLARACECYKAMRVEQGLWSEIRQEIAQNCGAQSQIRRA